jgi:hypothetical protein
MRELLMQSGPQTAVKSMHVVAKSQLMKGQQPKPPQALGVLDMWQPTFGAHWTAAAAVQSRQGPKFLFFFF